MKGASEPLSWLMLERYVLGELSPDERAAVEARLADSESDRACLAEILADKSELPPLAHDPVRVRGDQVVTLSGRAKRRTGRFLAVSAALCAAAAALLVLVRERPDQSVPAPWEYGAAVKGTDVSLRLISERRGPNPHGFSAGERFKVEVSCPPTLSNAVRLFVVQGSEVFEPLPRVAGFSCGNLVPWRGAFALDGVEPADVCVYWGTSARPSKRDFAGEASCSRLLPR